MKEFIGREPIFDSFDNVSFVPIHKATQEYKRNASNKETLCTEGGTRIFGQTGKIVDVTVREFRFSPLLSESSYPVNARIQVAKAQAKSVLLSSLHQSVDEIVARTLGKMKRQAEVCNCPACQRHAKEFEAWN